MSYSILLKHNNGNLTEIPFSSEKLFQEYWKPLFSLLHLNDLKNIEFSHTISKAEFAEIIRQLRIVMNTIDDTIYLERIGFVLLELGKVKRK